MEVAAVSGASMGALIGGLVATDRLEDYATWVSGLRRSDVLRLVDPAWSGPGAISAERVLGEMNELIGDVAIEDLPIPFTAVATDLVARREVWFQRGPLHAAIRASIAIPGVITPVLINGRLLVDGGLLNPVPIEPLAGATADLTVAVSLAGPRAAREPESPSRESTAPQRFEVWRERLRRTFASLSGGEEADGEPEEADTGRGGHSGQPDPVADGDDRWTQAEPGSTDLSPAARQHPGAPTALSHLDGPPARLRHSALSAHPSDDARDGDDRWTQAEAERRRWWRLRAREAEEAAPSAFQELPPGLRLSDVTALSFDAMQGMITRYRMAGLPPDLLVTVPVSSARTMDFHRAAELIELGAELTGQALDEAGYGLSTASTDRRREGE